MHDEGSMHTEISLHIRNDNYSCVQDKHSRYSRIMQKHRIQSTEYRDTLTRNHDKNEQNGNHGNHGIPQQRRTLDMFTRAQQYQGKKC